MVANILPADLPYPDPALGMGSVGQNSTFSEHGHVSNQKTIISTMQQHGSKYFPKETPDSGDGVSRSKFNFSEHGHVAYQINENHECSNMMANFLPACPPRPWGWDQLVIVHFFQNMDMWHIKLKLITNAALW